MDQDQDRDGRFSMDSPAIRSALLPLLERPAGPSRGVDIATPGSSPDLVCGRHPHFGRQYDIRFNETRDTCNEAGLIVNKKKSHLIPSQPLNYLG